MATVVTIERRVLQMDGGEFQKLCDAYLSAIGFGKPNAFGSKAGSNKVKKGTPDTFFERPNGKLVFAEYTTQQNNLKNKLFGDLDKCLNEGRARIPINRLEEIVFCFTSQLGPSEVLALRSKCEEKGIKLTLFGISALANDLVNHPYLVHQFLGLSLDTGQVIPLESFPSVYSRSKFAVSLETNFHFREEEIDEFAKSLETYDLVVIAGKAGVGKTRFALEGCRNFIARHSEYRAFSIVSQSQNLYEDLLERFSSPGQFLILVDDANRVMNFSYFLYILRNQKTNQHIKVIATVRDYALEKIKNDIFNFPHKSLQLDRFTDDQIKELAKGEFKILNPIYLERIIKLSAGNSRIAMMVSRIAVEKNTLESIYDVSAIYNEYFSSIKEDLKNFEESNLLKTAGIIAFFRAVDRTNEQMVSGIESAFRISPEVFWASAYHLHRLEMVDMYEDEVVRISDQVLSTYLFYLAFFKEKVLDFSDILLNYFPGFRSKIHDALVPVINAFDKQEISGILMPKIHRFWEILEENGNEEHLFSLAESFYYFFPEKTLLLIKNRLAQANFGPADFSQLEQLDENKINNVKVSRELQLLGQFQFNNLDLRNVVLEIIFEHLKNSPADILQVLHILVKDLGFNQYTNQMGVLPQQQIVNSLWEYAGNGQNELFSRLFISLAGEYLKTNFQIFEMHSNTTVKIYRFNLQPKPELTLFRTTIVEHLAKLYQFYPKQVFTVLEHYIRFYHQDTPTEIFANDAIPITKFIRTSLSPVNFAHIIFVNNFCDFLEDHYAVFDNNLREEFRNDTLVVYQLLSEDRRDFMEYELEEYEHVRKERFTSYFASLTALDIKHYVDLCMEISDYTNNNHERYEIVSAFGFGFDVLAETREDLFKVALRYYLQKGDKLELYPPPFSKYLVERDGKEQAFTFLNEFDYPTRMRWLFGYCQSLTPDQINVDDLLSLYKLFQDADYSQLPYNLDFLLNYVHMDYQVVAKVSRIILEKGNNSNSARILNTITNPYSELNKQLLLLFKNDLEILKEVYLTVNAGREHGDHNSATLAKILELDPGFIEEYVEWIYTPRAEDSRWHHDSQDYSALWRNQDFFELFKRIINLVYRKEKIDDGLTELRHFFMSDLEKQLDNDINQRQEVLLTELINTCHQDIEYIKFLFEVIAYFPEERRSRYIFIFLQNNKSFKDFQELTLEPGSRSWSGSAVPMYQKRIDFFKSLIPMLNRAQLLEHRNYIEQLIHGLEYRKNQEKKRDFIGYDD